MKKILALLLAALLALTTAALAAEPGLSLIHI